MTLPLRRSLREAVYVLRAAPAFVAAVAATLVAAGFNGLMVILMMLNVALPGPFGQMTHFQEPHHRVHDITFGLLFVPAVAGALAQLRRPVRNVAGMIMAVVPSLGLSLTALLTFIVGKDTRVLQPPWIMVGAALLIALSRHPAAQDFFRSFRARRTNRVLLGLVIAAGVPLLVSASTNIALQATGGDDHAAAGHYGFMAAFSFTVIGIGVLASLRPDGWRLTAWVAGLLPFLLGLASLVNRDAASSLAPALALAAIAWGAAFVGVAERRRTAETGTQAGRAFTAG